MLKLNNIFRVLPIALMSASLSLQAAEPSVPRDESSEADRATLEALIKSTTTPGACFYIKPKLAMYNKVVALDVSQFSDFFASYGFELGGSYTGTVENTGEVATFVVFCRKGDHPWPPQKSNK